jgi:hypothetical protein
MIGVGGCRRIGCMFAPAPVAVRAWAVAAAGDRPVDASAWTVLPVEYGSPSPTTGGLYRVVGAGWSVFVKVVQSFRHWDLLPVFPPHLRAEALATTSWRIEADLYGSALGELLPAGMRLPVVHAIDDDGDDRVVVVLEDVDADRTPWDVARYADAAGLLGRLDARLTAATHLPTTELQAPGALLRRYVDSRVVPLCVPALVDPATWRHPLLAGHAELRDAFAELASQVPALLDSLAAFTQLRMHGDATPHNLLVARDRPDELVVIDWAMGAVAPAGEELGQLLLGGAHDGVLGPGDLVALRDVVVPAYVAGLAVEGVDVAEAEVRRAMDTAITLRSAFSALPLERLGEPVTDELAALVAHRVELTRHLVDVGLSLEGVSAPRGGR